MKAQYLPNHVFIGIFTYFGAAFTAVIGIQEKNSANSCGYDLTLTEPDYNPASHYWNLYAGCRLSNGLGKRLLFVGTLRDFVHVLAALGRLALPCRRTHQLLRLLLLFQTAVALTFVITVVCKAFSLDNMASLNVQF